MGLLGCFLCIGRMQLASQRATDGQSRDVDVINATLMLLFQRLETNWYKYVYQ